MTVKELFEKVGLKCSGVVKWGTLLSTDSKGVYIISTSEESDKNVEQTSIPLFDEQALSAWIERLPAFTIDGAKPTIESLKARLSEFWQPQENILYIGKATSLKDRVCQFYTHELGASKPHSGGHWLKTLKNMNNLYVHYALVASIDDSEQKEQKMLSYFYSQVGEIPFANLEMQREKQKKYKKAHGLKRQREQKK